MRSRPPNAVQCTRLRLCIRGLVCGSWADMSADGAVGGGWSGRWLVGGEKVEKLYPHAPTRRRVRRGRHQAGLRSRMTGCWDVLDMPVSSWPRVQAGAWRVGCTNNHLPFSRKSLCVTLCATLPPWELHGSETDGTAAQQKLAVLWRCVWTWPKMSCAQVAIGTVTVRLVEGGLLHSEGAVGSLRCDNALAMSVCVHVYLAGSHILDLVVVQACGSDWRCDWLTWM